jgi:hypothetical protein
MTIDTTKLYPRSRCLHLRATCMQQARKHKDAGRKAVMLEWIGHAVYWSTRARTGLAPDAAQAIAHERGKRYAVRSKPQHAATLAAAVAAMAPHKGPAAVPANGPLAAFTGMLTGSVA